MKHKPLKGCCSEAVFAVYNVILVFTYTVKLLPDLC